MCIKVLLFFFNHFTRAAAVTYSMYECVWMSVSSYCMSVYLTCPRRQLLSASVSVTVKDAVVVQRDYGGMTLFVTVVTDSSLPPGSMCKRRL